MGKTKKHREKFQESGGLLSEKNVGKQRTAQPKRTKKKNEKKEVSKVKCPKCSQKFAKLNTMNQHFERSHNGKRYQCQIVECGKNLSSAYRLRTHMAKIHSVEDVNTKSSIVKVHGNECEIASEAKSELISVQQKSIEKLQKQIERAQNRFESLKNQLKQTE